MRQVLLLVLFGIVVCQKKNPWNSETADQRLDSVITNEFKARDADGNGKVTPKEIRDYYENHPDKMSKEGLDFIDRNFNKSGNAVDLEGYRKLIKDWLTEKGSVEKILVGVFGNSTKSLPTQNVWRKTTKSP
uniref:EF-hand domain-containing protein n=1 Tax=Caenorhabditis tropicalis TaxID=1561998 RepID=A0A1I7TFH9_9PELO